MENSTFQKQSSNEPNDRMPRVPFGAAASVNALLDANCGIEQPTPPLHRRKSYGDRFVPSRLADNMRTRYNLSQAAQQSSKRKNRENELPDPRRDQANSLFTSVLETEVASRPYATMKTPPSSKKRRLLTYDGPGTPPLQRPADIPLNTTYHMSPVSLGTHQLLHTQMRQIRDIPKLPYRILDAPGLANDFYLSLLDWSSMNMLGVGLGTNVYLWNGNNAKTSILCNLERYYDSVASVCWHRNGLTLAVGTRSGELNTYDAETRRLLRSYPLAHDRRIGTLDWIGDVISSGSKDGSVQHRDIREPSLQPFKRGKAHRDEVCGLKWSGEDVVTSTLATGGNDNKVCIWELRGSKRASGTQLGSWASMGSGDVSRGDAPLWKFREHKAAVKALAWNPHVRGMLATGGGAKDRHIQFWNTVNGKMLHELDTGSQVCNLLWSQTSHEIVSTQGWNTATSQYHTYVWQFPSLDMVASLTGHFQRVLYLAMSPNGESIVTGSPDQTLRFWHVFPPHQGPEKKESLLDHGKLIR